MPQPASPGAAVRPACVAGAVALTLALAVLTGAHLAAHHTGHAPHLAAVDAVVWPLGALLLAASAALLVHAVRAAARARGLAPGAALCWVLAELRVPGFLDAKPQPQPQPRVGAEGRRRDGAAVAAVAAVAAAFVLLLAAFGGLSGVVAANRGGGDANTTVRAAVLNGGQRVLAPPLARAETVVVETTFLGTVVRVVGAVPRVVAGAVRTAGAKGRVVRPDGMFDSNRTLVVAFTLAPGAAARVRLDADAPVRAELWKNNASAEVRADVTAYALDVVEPAADPARAAAVPAGTTYLLNVTAPRGAARVSYSVVVNSTRYAAEETAVQTVRGARRHALALRPGQLVVVEQRAVPPDMYPIFEDFAVVFHRCDLLATVLGHTAWHVLYAATAALFSLYWLYYYIVLYLLACIPVIGGDAPATAAISSVNTAPAEAMAPAPLEQTKETKRKKGSKGAPRVTTACSYVAAAGLAAAVVAVAAVALRLTRGDVAALDTRLRVPLGTVTVFPGSQTLVPVTATASSRFVVETADARVRTTPVAAVPAARTVRARVNATPPAPVVLDFCVWNATFVLAPGATLAWDLAATAPVEMRLLDAAGRAVAAHNGTAWAARHTHPRDSTAAETYRLRVERDYGVPVLAVRALTLAAPLYDTQHAGWPSVVGAGTLDRLARPFAFLCVEPAAPDTNVSWAAVTLAQIDYAPAAQRRALARLDAHLAAAGTAAALAAAALLVYAALWLRHDLARPAPAGPADPAAVSQPLLSTASD